MDFPFAPRNGKFSLKMHEKTTEEFARALDRHAAEFGVRLEREQTAQLCAYYEIFATWNARLHLVAPCSPTEFATRHVLESLTAAAHFPPNARVTDVGSGAGLPLIPCLIVRPDAQGTFVEASRKKAIFLREALRATAVGRAQVIAERFENLPSPAADVITCRALERFSRMLPQLIKWAPPASALLLFGGPELSAQLNDLGVPHERAALPRSRQRLLLIVPPRSDEAPGRESDHR